MSCQWLVWSSLVWSSLAWSSVLALENGVYHVSNVPSISGDTTSEGSTYWTAQKNITDEVLRPYRPLASPAASPAATSRAPSRSWTRARRDQKLYDFNHPPIRTERFCYQLIYMEDDDLEAVVRLPRMQNGSKECYNTDFPTHSAHLGNAEIVLDLKTRPDAVNASSIQHISVSPGDEQIAVVFGPDEWVDLSYAGIEPSGMSLIVQSLVVKSPPILLTQEFNHLIVWNQDRYLYYTAFNSSASKANILRHEKGKDATQSKIIFEQLFQDGYITLHHTKNYIYVTLSTQKESKVMVARRSNADLVWHALVKAPRDMIFSMDEVMGGVVLCKFEFITGQVSLISFIPDSSMQNLLGGHVLRNEDVQAFNNSGFGAAVQDMTVKANGLCLLRRQLITSSNAFQLNAHRVEAYTNENGTQSTKLGNSIPVTTDIPVEDLYLSSVETANGTRAEMLYFGVLHAAHLYSVDCSTHALCVWVLARVIDHQGFDAEPYHESIEQTLTPNGSPVSWILVYRKDMVKKDGANPLILLPVNSPNRASRYLQGMVELMDKGFVFALARLDRELATTHVSTTSTSKYLSAIKQTVVRLETVINGAIHLNLTRNGRVAVVAGGAVAMSAAHLVNEKPHLLQAAVLKGASLRVSTFAFMKSMAARSPKTWKQALALDTISNLPLNGTSTNILVLTSQEFESADSSVEYVTALRQNANNTGLALLDVPLDGRPTWRDSLQLINFHIRPFLLRTLCPNWLKNQTCMQRSAMHAN